jgi:malate dehydrogenase (oxaloacetate-decarboxylating)
MFIYPGVGLAAVATGAKRLIQLRENSKKIPRISVSMFSRAAEVLSACVSDEDIQEGKVYPDVNNIRAVSLQIAVEGE